MIKFEIYSENYLMYSWKWLNDPEIKFLTVTGDFTQDDQIKWFETLKDKSDYKIWGVSYNAIPIGVFGIKNIDWIAKKGEYWGYIGEKEFHGKGLGSEILQKTVEKSVNELFLEKLYLKVLRENIVAINLYKKFGFLEIETRGNQVFMEKYLI